MQVKKHCVPTSSAEDFFRLSASNSFPFVVISIINVADEDEYDADDGSTGQWSHFFIGQLHCNI
ncbi:hypothetical protein BLOT_011335 [Blomia tropicalis]|nr:hypothetical protein BLOT_011335 [Blomia tropicalis]